MPRLAKGPMKTAPRNGGTRTAHVHRAEQVQVAEQCDPRQGGIREQRPSPPDASHDDDSTEDPMDIFFSSYQRFINVLPVLILPPCMRARTRSFPMPSGSPRPRALGVKHCVQ